MATKKVGTLVKEARTTKGLTQEQLARKVTGASASDISELERGKTDFTQAQLKQIAKACDVTQASLLNAPKNLGSTAKKTTTTAKKTGTTSSTAKKSTSTTKKTTSTSAKKASTSKTSSTSTAKKSTTKTSTSSTGTSMKVSATEKKLVELYRDADATTKKVVMGILKGERPEPPAPGPGGPFGGPLPGTTGTGSAAGTNPVDEFVGSIISGALDMLGRR